MTLASALALLLAALVVIIFIICGAARAHDAPTGWAYPFSCCSGYDCREVPDDWIVEGQDGYRIVITGETIPMTNPKIKQSPDGRFHWCSVAGLDDSRTICLFVPARGS
ncbi:MAG: hypothetical protein E5W95_18165 [Mesorhizobium sp.]|nr:MAG: hypothetical protein E5W95_18165 [Mesorhizobium sp.]